ncbi:MAG: PAS domain S-box protein, partial [Limibaculum sp.]
MATTSAKDGTVDLEVFLDRLAREGESIVIERDGRPVAILAPFDDSATQHDPARSDPATSAAHLKAIMDRSPVEIGLKDTAGRYVMVSRRFEELNGVTSDEVAGKTAYDVFPEETARAIEVHDAEVLRTGEVSEREMEVPLDDGVHAYLTVKFPIVDAEGRVTGIGAISSDITERKRAQKALREAYDDLDARVAARTEELTEANRALRAQEAQFRLAHQITRLGHWSWCRETDRLSVSPEMAAILGVAPKELEVITNAAYVERFVHPDDRERVHEHGGGQDGEKGRSPVEYRLSRPDGSERWVEELGEAVVDEAGKAIGEVGTIQDITDRKRDEAALRESEARFRAIFEQGAVGVAMMRPDGTFVQVNPAYCNFIGHRAEELVGRHFETVIHPDDLLRVKAHREAVMAGTAIEPVDERRYLHKSGDVLWGLAGLTVLRGPDGGVTSYIVQVQDITERKRAERALQGSEERLRDFAEATSDWFWEMDADLRFSYVSNQIAAVAGLDPRNSIGKTRWEFVGVGSEDGKWRQHSADLLARVAFRDFRYEWAKDDGKRQHFSISGKPVFDERGDFKGYRGTGTNITAEVEAQSRTEEVRARFFDAIENSTEAIALFDKGDKLVLSNSRYREIVDRVVPGLLQPGIPFERIVREGARKGLYDVAEQDIERMVAQRLEDHHNLPSVRQHRLGDGSWAQVREQRTSDGGVMLVQTDTTELRESEARLRQAQKMEAVGQL